MEAKLRVLLEDRIEKLVLPLGISPTVEELQTVVKETFGILDEFSLQYWDSEFEDFFTLLESDQIKHKDTIKVVQADPIILTFHQLDESVGSHLSQKSTDYESASYVESSASDAESSTGTSSSQDTIILPKRSTTERYQPWPKPWPKQFPIPPFTDETEMYLESAFDDYKKNGQVLTTSKVKADILETLVETIYAYTAYPSSAEISYVAEALVNKYPCLKEPGSVTWQQSIKFKMANYRYKLRRYGVPEVMCNVLKRKSPADQKPAKSVKKPRKAEVNYLPPYPAGEDEKRQEQERLQLLTEVKKKDNKKLIKEKMAKTFAHRRNEMVNLSPSIEDINARWPALFEASHIQDEFHRITMVNLESKFMSKLDEYTPKLLSLFQSKGGTIGLRLHAILLKAPSNPCIDVTRDVVIRCLMLYLGESTDQLLKEYDDADEDVVSQDLAVQKMKIYNIKTKTSEDPDVGIVVDGIKVLSALSNMPRACSMLVGLAYAVNLAYPKELRYTFEAFQKLFLELDSSKLSPKVNSLKNKLLA